LTKERFVIREKIVSTAAIPLRAGEESMGLMFANYRTHQVFREEQKELIELFAKQAAIAIKNARMDQRLKILEEIGKKLTSSPRLREHEILELIYTEGSSVTDTRNMFVALYEEPTDTLQFKLVFKDSKRDKTIERRWENRRAGKGKSEWIIRNKEPLLFNTRNEIKNWYNQPEHERPEGALLWDSWLGVPMMVENKVFGVIAIRHPAREHAFDENDVRVLSSIGSQAAIAIDNARLYYDVNQRQKALVEIGQRLTAGIRLRESEVLELIYKQASKELGMENLSIALYDETTDTIQWALAVVNNNRIDVKNEEGWETRPARKGKTGKIIKSKKYLLLPSIKEVKKAKFSSQPNLPPKKGDIIPNCWLGVPMMVGGKVLGVIANYDYGKDYAYDEDYIKILQALANQAAIAISNSRVFDRLSELNKRQQALVEFGSQLDSKISLGETEILEFIHQQAEKFMDTNNMYIALYDEEEEMVNFPLIFQDGKPIEIKSRKAGKGRTEEIIRTGEHIFINTKQEAEEWYQQPGREEYTGKISASWIGVPMKLGNKIFGVVATYHPTQDNVYNENDLEILKSMADVATIAIENAKLYQSLDEKIEELERAQKSLDEKIEELERAQKKIAESEAIITRTSIAADFVHRLNNLAGTIPIWLDQIRDHLGSEVLKDKTLSDYLTNIESNTDGLLRAAEHLKSPPKVQEVDLKTALDSLVRQTRVQTSANIHVQLKLYQEKLPAIQAIASELTNALWSIMENGIDAMPQGGTLTIEAKAIEDTSYKKWVEVRITDTGKGIAEKNFDKVFSPFLSTKAEHLGYGLWRAKNIIEKIGGNISFESKEGKGTIFIIKLPALKEGNKNEN
jgi:GAF domain-containing protein/anti-sigma regulatory factor (Ser/Thr protein kinase)